MKTDMTILITGGHLTPAVAVMDEIATKHPTWRTVFVGRPYALEGTTIPSEEERVIRKRGVAFFPLITGRFMRQVSIEALVSLFKVPLGVFGALGILARVRPMLVVSFGGYVALPVVVAAFMRGIPIITHEQTQDAGLANRIIARLARKVCVSFEETLSVFPEGKAVVTGLPLRRSLFGAPKKAAFPLPHDPGNIFYITGGATGAASFNAIVYRALKDLLAQGTVVHQVGRYSYDEAVKVKRGLPPALRARYIVRPYVDGDAYVWLLHRAHVVIGRAGANTVSELAALAKVAILVPLPWSAGGEQQKNAQWLAANGGAIVVSQKELDAKKLLRFITETLGSWERLSSRAKSFARLVPRDGAVRMAAEIEHLLALQSHSSL
jgi:UDP-N-acetylglucosamine--N-acetylmuramyl-(pentapeptide) pyrophosphoryl-undecaprenol N-acetylglucosamine transferase